jgi:penicillin G amidase
MLLRWIKRITLFIGALLVLLIVAVLGYRQLSLPQTTGEIAITAIGGSSAPLSVKIVRDASGVPTIEADNLSDASYAVGFAHAQDRRWQMEMNHRIASGTLSEILGPASLDTDRFLRTLGIARAAAAQAAKFDSDTLAALQRYADGVNAGTQAASARAPEFMLLGIKPTPWTVQDSIGWSLMMAWDLGGNWANEALRMRLAARYTTAQIDQLLPPQSPQPGPLADYPALYKSLGIGDKLASVAPTLLAAMPHIGLAGVEGLGSNNWVLHGSRTTTGKPLLANDPHLGLSAPALWYFARIKTPQIELVGATLPGLPSVVLGRNQYVAWGFTNTGPDVQDLYLEKLVPGGVQGPAGVEAITTVNEIIKVKGQPDINLPVRISARGPFISDVQESARLALGAAASAKGDAPGYALSFRWTALDIDNTTIRSGMKMNLAKSGADFIAAARDYVAPMQNMVWADVQGNIGLVSAGRVPVRGAQHDLRGQAPAPAWDARYAWQGFLSFDQLPQMTNPANGYIATANQNITFPAADGTPYKPYITSEWAAPYRMQRITQLMQAKPKHDMDSLKGMHADVKSVAVMRFTKALGQIAPASEPGKRAWALLQSFDGTMAADRAEPLIYNAWIQHAARRVFGDEIVRDMSETTWRLVFARRDLFSALVGVLETQAPWCDDVSTPAKEACADVMALALDDAVADLAKTHGADMATWRWGTAHYARSEHRPFGRQPQLAKLFDLRVPTGGDNYTVNVGRAAQRDGEPFVNMHAASLRALYDLANPQGAWSAQLMHSTGQSGNVFSPHYRDFSDAWARVQYLDMGASGNPQAEVLTLKRK